MTNASRARPHVGHTSKNKNRDCRTNDPTQALESIRAREAYPTTELEDSSVRIHNFEDGQRFLSALLSCQQQGKARVLYRLLQTEGHGLMHLKAALKVIKEPYHVRDCVLPLLALLSSDELKAAACKSPLHQVLSAIAEVPNMFTCLYDALVVIQDATPVAWLCLALAQQDVRVRRRQDFLQLCGRLRVPDEAEVVCAEVAQDLNRLIGNSMHLSMTDLPSSSWRGRVEGRGGRHDNDLEDFREVQILPTVHEVLCTRPSYLPPAIPTTGLSDAESEDHLLDRQFRLLREEMVQPLRTALADLWLGQAASSQASDAQGPASEHPEASPATKLAGSVVQPTAKSHRVFPVMSLEGVQCDRAVSLMVSIQLPQEYLATHLQSRAQREKFWDEYGKGLFPHGSLVCLVKLANAAHSSYAAPASTAPGTPNTRVPQLVELLFGEVRKREAKDLARECPMLGITLRSDLGARQAFVDIGQVVPGWMDGPVASTQGLKGGSGTAAGLSGASYYLIQGASIFFKEPILKALQAMLRVPLAEELVHMRPEHRVPYLDAVQVKQAMRDNKGLEVSQAQAFKHALTHRVALIQGPPGTGKTFIGVLLCKSILRLAPGTRILVVCYKNHALDQFLEALLEKGIDGIARLGNRSNSDTLTPYKLRNLAQQRVERSTDRDRMADRHSCMATLAQKIEELQHVLYCTSISSSRTQWEEVPQLRSPSAPGNLPADSLADPQDCSSTSSDAIPLEEGGLSAAESDGSDLEDSDDISDLPPPHARPSGLDLEGTWERFLEVDLRKHAEWFAAIADKSVVQRTSSPRPVPPPFKSAYQAWQQWLQGYTLEQSIFGNGTFLVRKPAWPTPFQNAWQTVVQGAAHGRTSSDTGNGSVLAHRPGDPWKLPLASRQQLASQWLADFRTRCAEDLCSAAEEHAEASKEVAALQRSYEQSILKECSIIGCTSTGAALYKDLLQSPGVAPQVVLVEEAGELLEAHVLTSLSNTTQHLIMIGDHKQLRPQVETYPLSVASGQGHNLNMSLFERLVLAGFPHGVLGVQHRMHPDISELVKHTYPGLTDHESVHLRDRLRGVKATRLLWIDHRSPDEDVAALQLCGATVEAQTKVNKWEVQMTVSVVLYLLQQGYQPHQLVVLTPYKGQAMRLQEALKAKVKKSALSEDCAGAPWSDALEQGRMVRVATVDNFQGEEAEVIVASLVRSNDEGAVGFLGEPQRVNVLMSRARAALVLIGNSTTFRTFRPRRGQSHWAPVLHCFDSAHAIHPGLPVTCRHHSQALLTPSAGAATAGLQGSCSQPCFCELPCGHKCLLRCHLDKVVHEQLPCPEVVLRCCPGGHVHVHRCYEGDSTACKFCEGHQQLPQLQLRQGQNWTAQLARIARNKNTDSVHAKLAKSMLTDNTNDALADVTDSVFAVRGLHACLRAYASSGTVSEPAVPTAVKAALDAAQAAEWLTAQKTLERSLRRPADTPAPTAAQEDVLAAQTLLEVVKILQGKRVSLSTDQALAVGLTGQVGSLLVVLLQHLAKALAADAAAGRTQGIALTLATDLAARRDAIYQAVGHSMAVLMHPHKSLLGGRLLEKAELVRKQWACYLQSPQESPLEVSVRENPFKSGQSEMDAWRQRAEHIPSLQKLLELTGMMPVKRALFALTDRVMQVSQEGEAMGAQLFHACFYGVRGTGRATVARIYAELLRDLSVTPGAQVEETDGAALLKGGVSKLQEHLKAMEEGGVLFLDEAYQLNPKTNPMGAQVCATLAALLRDTSCACKVVVVLAGAKEQMDELLAQCPQMAPLSRQHLAFPAWTAEDAQQRLLHLLQEKHGLVLQEDAQQGLPGLIHQLVSCSGRSAAADLVEWAETVADSLSLLNGLLKCQAPVSLETLKDNLDGILGASP